MKIVLIPEAEYRKLLPEGGIKATISKIVSRKRNHECAKEMSQLFGRYLRITKQQPQIQPPKPSDKLQLLSHFQPIYHGKVSKVLAEFEKYGTSWTNRNELVLKSGKVITNSNIIDLLKEALVGTRRKERRMPDGWKQFIEEIVDSDMSKDIFTKKTTREDIKNEIKGREERHFPEELENF